MSGYRLFYLVFAAFCSLGTLGLCGYALVHGSGELLWVAPVCLALFLLPLWLTSRFKTKFAAIRLTLLLPVLLIGAPLLYALLLRPAIERLTAEIDLSHLTFTPMTEEVLLAPGNVPLALKLTYNVDIPTDLHSFVPGTSGMFPQVWLTAGTAGPVTYNPASTEIALNGQLVDTGRWYGEGIGKGIYRVTSVFHPTEIKLQDGQWCRVQSGASPAGKAEEFLAPVQLHAASSITLSLRMGTYFHRYTPIRLHSMTSPAEVHGAVMTLPLCHRLSGVTE